MQNCMLQIIAPYVPIIDGDLRNFVRDMEIGKCGTKNWEILSKFHNISCDIYRLVWIREEFIS